MNGARVLLGWAGKEYWERGPWGWWGPGGDSRGCSWAWGQAPWVCSSPSGWGVEGERQKNFPGGQVGGMQYSQITSFLRSCWFLVLPQGRPSASTLLGYLAHGLPGI